MQSAVMSNMVYVPVEAGAFSASTRTLQGEQKEEKDGPKFDLDTGLPSLMSLSKSQWKCSGDAVGSYEVTDIDYTHSLSCPGKKGLKQEQNLEAFLSITKLLYHYTLSPIDAEYSHFRIIS